MNSPVTFNDATVDLPHQSPIHHLRLINISREEPSIKGLLWNTSSNLMSLTWPPLENHLAEAPQTPRHLWRLRKTALLRTRRSAFHGRRPSTFPSSARIQNAFPHADTIATFQFQLHLKPPISAAATMIEIWNPAYIQAITENTGPQLLSVCLSARGREGRGRNNRDQLQLEHISIYLLFNNVELAPDPHKQLWPNSPPTKMAALLNQEEIKWNPWSFAIWELKCDFTLWGRLPLLILIYAGVIPQKKINLMNLHNFCRHSLRWQHVHWHVKHTNKWMNVLFISAESLGVTQNIMMFLGGRFSPSAGSKPRKTLFFLLVVLLSVFYASPIFKRSVWWVGTSNLISVGDKKVLK